MILAKPRADPPCAEISIFFPQSNFGTNSFFHKGYKRLMRSLWLYEQGNSVLLIYAYRLSLEGCRSSLMSTGGGGIVKLLRHSATFCCPYCWVIYTLL